MNTWSRFDAAAAAMARVPERWAFERLAPALAVPRRPSRVQVIEGFAVVEAVSTELGPTEAAELTPHEGYGPGGLWPRFDERWPDLRAIRGVDMRAWLAENAYPSGDGDLRWVAQGWLRDQIGLVAQSILMEVPACYNVDPDELREAAFAGLIRVAPLLSDDRQSACLGLIIQQVEMRAYDLARHLYHHPNAGPGIRETIHDVFDAEHAAKLVAEPPGPDEAPPWI